jgi:hypothetical protein
MALVQQEAGRQPSRPPEGKGEVPATNPPSVDAGRAAQSPTENEAGAVTTPPAAGRQPSRPPEGKGEVPATRPSVVAGLMNTLGWSGSTSSPPSETTNIINDADFISDLKRLRELRSFFLQEAVIVERDSTALRFGKLNMLRSPLPMEESARPSRAPTEDEYDAVESHWQTLLSLLTPALRRRFVLGAIPQYLAWTPIGFAVIALSSLYFAISEYGNASAVAKAQGAVTLLSIGVAVLPYYLLWLMSLGAIGALAFIGMNALSLQEDITFDLTNSRLILLRITLGSLFGLVLTLPFGFEGFLVFCRSITEGTGSGKVDNPGWTLQAILLLLPFVLGFSTSLVILILNRAVDAVQSFFGRTQPPPNQSQAQTPGSDRPPTQAAVPKAVAPQAAAPVKT